MSHHNVEDYIQKHTIFTAVYSINHATNLTCINLLLDILKLCLYIKLKWKCIIIINYYYCNFTNSKNTILQNTKNIKNTKYCDLLMYMIVLEKDKHNFGMFVF